MDDESLRKSDPQNKYNLSDGDKKDINDSQTLS